jgi:iron(III) transport system substrate-binding protein
MNRSRITLAGLIALIAIGLTWPAWRRSVSPGRPAPLVVYCAHDAVFSEQILRDFEKRTGIPIEIRFDTEATKSLGLVNLIIQESPHPRCDVFWNNQVLSTMELQQRGLLEPYRGLGFERIPPRFKDVDGHWTGFAARLRVYILRVPPGTRPDTPSTPDSERDAISSPEAFADLPKQLNHWAIAKPLYGTTNSHYALLWHLWGEEKLKSWHRELRRRGIREASGNGAVKNLVAEGICEAGFTDTDDFFAAKDDGKSVTMLPVLLDGKTISIPNSVAIIRGTKNRDAAQKLVDFLLSAETELALARSPARQIPLGIVDVTQLPDEVMDLRHAVLWADGPLDLLPAQTECLRWLKSEYLQGE